MAPDWTELPGNGVAFLSLSLLFTFLGVCAFSARTYTSWTCTKRFRLDYWLSLFTFTLLCVSQSFFAVSIVFGIGAHMQGLRPHEIVVAMRTSWINMISAIIAIVTGKLSIIAFLDQIRGRHQGRPWFLWFIGASNIIVNITVVITILLQCSPVEKIWDNSVPGNCDGRPLNLNYAYFQGSYSAVSDAVLAIYPIYLIWGLQVTLRMKVGLCFLLGFGLIAAACSALKTAELRNLQHADEEDDITFFVARLSLTTIIEAWIVLVASHPYQRYDKYGMPSLGGRVVSSTGKILRASLTSRAITGNHTRVYYDPKGDAGTEFEMHKPTVRGASDSDKTLVPLKDPGKAIVMTRVTDVDFS
ncbi:hypothetical protein J7T55_000251 [Diaporthe amygdali]|uniref:uncharacterized protein n=1 Tax=Phomopsis amygdali TaxID=1214568 RepID=UPI0022FEE35B|nr:uncharacterized protein J7T55_000251 [Diaporthe amygdali]KAJ0109326.1 hypothetical protein J7T55_000251 [Diaporthe amygdali]